MRTDTAFTMVLICWFALTGSLLCESALAQDDALPAGEIELATPDLTRVVRLGSEQRAWLRLTGPLQGRLNYEIESLAGDVIFGSVDVSLDREETKSITVFAHQKFPGGEKFEFDPFDPAVRAMFHAFIRSRIEQSANDPLCMGYSFIDIPVWDERRIEYFRQLPEDAPGRLAALRSRPTGAYHRPRIVS